MAAALLLAGCGGGSAEDEGSSLEEPARAPNQDLRVAVGEDPFMREAPAPPNIGLLSAGPNPGIFETLTRLTGNFGLGPGLATRWESGTPRQWRFFLRPNVTFHNGARLDAQAVVATLETVARRQNRPRGLDPGSARAVDDSTVAVDLATDNARLAEQLANPNMGIVAAGTEPGLGEDPASTPTGTGPYRFESYRTGQELKVRAHDEYWGGAPILRSITFRFGPDADAGRLLATRQVDLVGQVPYDVLPKVSGRTDRLVGSRPARAEYLLLNAGGIDEFVALKDEAVRKAVVLALDRKAVAKGGWPEDGEENNSLIPEIVLGEAGERVKAPAQNLEEAKRLLTAAGWSSSGDGGLRMKDGRPLDLALVLARPPEQQRAAEVVKAQLAGVGVGIHVVDAAADGGAFARVNTGTFDLYMASQVQDDGNPCAMCRFFTVRPGGQLAFAGAAGGGPKADDLYDRVYASPSTDTVRRLAADLINVVVAERFTAIPIASLKTQWLASPRVRGFEPAALGGDQRWETTFLTL